MITRISDYYLDQPIYEAPNLTEFTNDEYVKSEKVGIKRTFESEKFFKVPDTLFLGFTWNIMIASTKYKIYKISIQHFTENEQEAKKLFENALKNLNSEMGEYTKHKKTMNLYSWDRPEGNVILAQQSQFGFFGTNIHLTSNTIRNQVRLAPFINLIISSIQGWLFRHQLDIFWNPLFHSDEENLNWCSIRSIEWTNMPSFVTQPLVPIILLKYSLLHIFIALFILNVLWSFIRYKFVNLKLAILIMYFVIFFKWPVSITLSIYFLFHADYFKSTICILWPFIGGLIGFFPGKASEMQRMFMAKLGYEHKDTL